MYAITTAVDSHIIFSIMQLIIIEVYKNVCTFIDVLITMKRGEIQQALYVFNLSQITGIYFRLDQRIEKSSEEAIPTEWVH